MPSGFRRENVFGAGQRGDHGNARAHVHQAAQDVALDSEIASRPRGKKARPVSRELRKASKRSTVLSQEYGEGVETRVARSRPAIDGACRAR